MYLLTVCMKLELGVDNYRRERQVTKGLAAVVNECIITKGTVIPTNTKKNMFTTGDMDNIDQHKQSNLSKVEFYGTLITLASHLSKENTGTDKEASFINNEGKSKTCRLPDF